MKAQERPTAKVCRKCGEKKDASEFHKGRSRCKKCELEGSKRRYERNKERVLRRCAEYREQNKDRIKSYLAQWYVDNRDHVLSRCKEYNERPEVKQRERERQAKRYAENRDAIQASRKLFYASNPEALERWQRYAKQYYSEHKAEYLERRNLRVAAELRAFPSWANRKVILSFYKAAKRKTLETGVKHVVDHIVPLRGRNVCGLHVETNLQVIPEIDNLRKFNKHG